MTNIIIKKDKLPQFGNRGVRYYITLDGERIDNQYFVATGEAKDYTASAEAGKHTLAVFEIAFTDTTAPKEVVSYEVEATQPDQTLYLKYNKKEKKLYFSETGAEETSSASGGKSGGFFKFFK